MAAGYVLGIDQSTQGTKLLLFDRTGAVAARTYRAHRQLVNDRGWVSHDMEEVYGNVIAGVRELLEKAGIAGKDIAVLGISNQRETTVAWDNAGNPICPAIVWQCGRAAGIVEKIGRNPADAEKIRSCTGIPLSPFFPAAKMRWLLENACRDVPPGELHLGTVDSYLVYRLTGGRVFATDASNASRTQLMELEQRRWSETICGIFGIPVDTLPKIIDSNGDFGETDMEGVLGCKVPIRCVMGDSHGALYGQRCHEAGMMKTTYGTGSSMMLNTGGQRVMSSHGLAASLAWSIDGVPSYVLEGNINYTGAVISWLKDDLELIRSVDEVNDLCEKANVQDTTVVVPAFTGLSAPYWENNVKAAILGMSRTTGKAELVKAAVESIAHQIADVYEAMRLDFGREIPVLRADGGPTKNQYLMQFTGDMTGAKIFVPGMEELSALGAAYLAGITAGVYDRDRVFENISWREYEAGPMSSGREARRLAWKEAVKAVLWKSSVC